MTTPATPEAPAQPSDAAPPLPAESVAAATAPAPAEPAAAPAAPTEIDLANEVRTLSERVAAIAPPADPAESLYDGLAGLGQPEDPPPAQQAQPQPAQVEAEQAQFDAYVRNLVQGALNPYLMQQEEARQTSGLEALEGKYADITDPTMVAAIGRRLAPTARRYGSEMVYTDPELVEQAYLAELAAKNAATEVPAEQAAAQGAHLETGASAAAPQSPLSADERDKQALLATRTGADAFT